MEHTVGQTRMPAGLVIEGDRILRPGGAVLEASGDAIVSPGVVEIPYLHPLTREQLYLIPLPGEVVVILDPSTAVVEPATLYQSAEELADAIDRETDIADRAEKRADVTHEHLKARRRALYRTAARSRNRVRRLADALVTVLKLRGMTASELDAFESEWRGASTRTVEAVAEVDLQLHLVYLVRSEAAGEAA